MSDKSVLCLACGRFTPVNDRVGGPDEPYTYHKACAHFVLEEVQAEFELKPAGSEAWRLLGQELQWLQRKLLPF